MRWWISLLLFFFAASVPTQEGAEQEYLRSWVPISCCVTNGCCFKISERELVPLPNDEWLIRSTGEVKSRTGWSPDGHFYRCACDYDEQSRRWVRHQGAHTRCLFVPMRLSVKRHSLKGDANG